MAPLDSSGPPVGIDDLNLYASTLVIDNALVAEARGTTRYLDVVRIAERSIAPAFEDAVTLAVNAALPLVEAAGRDAFELLIVATESGFDFGKPLSSYVHRYLGLGSRCRNLEVKHACYGGTASVQLAASWLRSGPRGKKALVVTTDLPGNQFGEPAELTPGTGAVAITLAAEPRVLELSVAAGYASREVYDTARPTATGHWVDEVLSLGAYLDLLELAYEHFRTQAPASALDQDLDHVVYHMPLETLILKAHGVLLESHDPDVTADEIAASFDRMVRPSLRYCERIGNIFSGTLYAGLAGLIDSGVAPHPGARVGLFSYGSGSCAEFFAGTLGDGAASVLAKQAISEHLGRRRALTLAEYETIVREREAIAGVSHWEPARDLPQGHYEDAYSASGRLVLQSVKDFYRAYGWS